MSSVRTEQAVYLVMERFQTVIIPIVIRKPCFIAEMAVGLVGLEQRHESLTKRSLRLIELLADQIVLAVGVWVLGLWVSQRVLPFVKLPPVSILFPHPPLERDIAHRVIR